MAERLNPVSVADADHYECVGGGGSDGWRRVRHTG